LATGRDVVDWQTLQIAVARQSHLVSLSPHHLQELGLLQQESEALAHGGKHRSACRNWPRGPAEPRTPDPLQTATCTLSAQRRPR
jgi:hypothetical protein